MQVLIVTQRPSPKGVSPRVLPKVDLHARYSDPERVVRRNPAPEVECYACAIISPGSHLAAAKISAPPGFAKKKKREGTPVTLNDCAFYVGACSANEETRMLRNVGALKSGRLSCHTSGADSRAPPPYSHTRSKEPDNKDMVNVSVILLATGAAQTFL